MLIFYGIRTAHLNSFQAQEATCPQCEAEKSLAYGIYSRHFHLFWIPVFPVGKTGVIACAHCGYQVDSGGAKDRVKAEYRKWRKQCRIPLWQFAGLLIFAGFLSWGLVSDYNERKDLLVNLSAPLPGDVCHFKSEEEGYYSSMKIIEVTGDSVLVTFNMYETDRKAEVYKIDQVQNYEEYAYSMSRETLLEWGEKKEIYRMSRKK